MRTQRVIHVAARLAVGLVVAVFVAGGLAPAFAATPPHVVLDSQHSTTDSCAICHRAHTATTVVPYRVDDTTTPTGTSLVLSTDPASGDVQLCFACHGQGQLGSNKDIQSLYQLSSVHGLVPATAPYGPSPIYCSTCHDSHGSARVSTDVPYPRLLRSFEGTAPVYAGEAYCATCHTAANATDMGERFASLAVFLTTGHYSGLSTPTSGTGIRCSWCHDPHGSAVAPLLVASIVPTAVPTTFTVTADDRTFCIACHGSTSATWEGSATYAASGHGSSTATVSITATWVPAGSRRIGECQVCHAPMGRDDGTGVAIPKLLDAKGRVQCDSCHAAGKVAASTDTSSQAYPVSESARPELVAIYTPTNGTTEYGRVSVYSRALSGAAPRPLIGPKEYSLALRTGPAAAGSVDPYLGGNQLVVGASFSADVSVIASDALTGLSRVPVTAAIPGGSAFANVAVANIIPNGASVLPDTDEIIGITGNGHLVVYDWTGSALSAVGDVTLPAGATWGLATGDLTGSGHSSIVVTNLTDGSITIAGDDGLGSIAATTVAAGTAPVAPSIGRVWNSAPAGQNQIIIGDRVSATSTVRVLDNTGNELAGYNVVAGTAKPTASGVGDVLPAIGGNEVALTFTDPIDGDATVVVVPRASPGPGLDVGAAVSGVIGSGCWTGSLLVGDVEVDAITEVVVGSSGTSAQFGGVAPSVQVWRADGTGAALAAVEPYVGGGTEMAGFFSPSLVLADFGPVLPSRHPIDEVAAAAHVSTETAPFIRHVTCSDCHNTHQGSTASALAPAVPGPLAGAWGLVGATTARASTQTAICYKCHSSYVTLGGRQDVAAQFGPAAISGHAVSGASTSTIPAATFVPGILPGDPVWTQSSTLYCTDCHGDSTGGTAAQKRELHKSGSAPLLNGSYLGVNPGLGAVVCYECHLYTVYAEGSADAASGMSYFQETAPTDRRLHAYHVAGTGGKGLSCSSCHVAHGSTTQPHLLRGDIGFSMTGDHAGSCATDCHLFPGAHPYPTP